MVGVDASQPDLPGSPDSIDMENAADLSFDQRRKYLLTPLAGSTVGGVGEDISNLPVLPCVQVEDEPRDDTDEGSSKIANATVATSTAAASEEQEAKQLSACTRFAIKVVDSPSFGNTVLTLILMNCVFLAISDPTTSDEEGINIVCGIADIIFTALFSVEIGFKWAAFGLCVFFKDPWNILDFLCVAIGYASMLPGSALGGFSGLRSLRALRPLRTLNSVPSIKNLVATIFNSGKLLGDVCVLIFFLLFLFAIVALQFFTGKLRYRCFSPLGSAPDTNNVCTVNPDFHDCPTGFECLETHHNPNFGYTSFDDTGSAILAIFMVMTLDSWSSQMYKIMFTSGSFTFCYFVMIVLLLSIFALNLTAAILASRFSLARMEKAAKLQQEEEKEEAEDGKVSWSDQFWESFGHLLRWFKPPAEESQGGCAKFRRQVRVVVDHSYFHAASNIVMFCYVTVLAMKHKDPSKEWVETVRTIDRVFTAIFLIELLLKLIGHNWYQYFSNSLNAFDAVVVLVTFMAVWVVEGLGNVGSLRLVRLLRVLQAARTLSQLKSFWRVVSAVQHTFKAMLSFCMLLLLIIFVYALLAMQFFGGKTDMDKFMNSLNSPILSDTYTRANFDNFFQSLITTFVALMGTWASTCWLTMQGTSPAFAGAFWISLVVIGNCILLNLLLAVLIDNISQKKDMDAEEDDKEAIEAAREAKMAFDCKQVAKRIKSLGYETKFLGQYEAAYDELSDYDEDPLSDAEVESVGAEVPNQLVVPSMDLSAATKDDPAVKYICNNEDDEMEQLRAHLLVKLKEVQLLASEWVDVHMPEQRKDNGKKIEKADSGLETYIAGGKVMAADMMEIYNIDTAVAPWYMRLYTRLVGIICGIEKKKEDEEPPPPEHKMTGNSLVVLSESNPLRVACYKIAFHWTFEALIIVLILISCVTLGMETPNLKDGDSLKDTLDLMNLIFTIIFTFECVVKIVALGFFLGEYAYCKNAWNNLDLFIVCISLLSLAISSSGVKALRAMRALRALRPLRLVSRMKGLKVVVDTIVEVLPSLGNVVVFTIIVWMFFAILGLHSFCGLFSHCSDNVSDKILCVGTFKNPVTGFSENREWVTSEFNFDNLGNAIYTLYTVATLDNWAYVMWDGIDASEVDKAPIQNNSLAMALYFVAFIVIGSMLVLNLFIGEIVNTYSRLASNTLVMSVEQRQWAMAVRMKMEQQQTTTIDVEPPPEDGAAYPCRKKCFEACTHPWFDKFIMLVIILNILSMAMTYYSMSKEYEDSLDLANDVFSVIFMVEFVVKFSGIGPAQYFADAWNILDLTIVLVSVMGMTGLGGSQLSIFRALRMLRIAKLIKTMKGLRSLLTTLFFSLPALGNVGMLLFLVVYIFAVLGMNLFGKVVHDKDGYLTEITNFENVWRAMLLLFRVLTFDDWRGIMVACQVKEPVCSEDLDNCGSWLAVPYFVCFTVVGTFVMLNIFTAVILLNFQSAALDEGLADIGYVSGAMFKMQRADDLILDLQARFKRYKKMCPARYPEEALSITVS